jgi:hypothetical protein
MLAGVPDYSETTWFSGANVDGELSVRGLRSLETFIRTPGQSRPSFDERSLRKAAAVGTEILRLFASPDHYRARIGFRKLVEGLKNRQPRGRLHEFVRAIDALMALETGKSTRQFVHRGKTFGAFSNANDDCRRFYDLRSAEEHLNDWTPLLDSTGTLGPRQREASATALLRDELTPQQRGRIDAACTDMHQTYLNAVPAVLPKADVVFDKFHVLQHASAALDHVRRQEFFRASAVMRAVGRGKLWLLLRRWKTVRGSKRRELEALFAANRRLFISEIQ